MLTRKENSSEKIVCAEIPLTSLQGIQCSHIDLIGLTWWQYQVLVCKRNSKLYKIVRKILNCVIHDILTLYMYLMAYSKDGVIWHHQVFWVMQRHLTVPTSKLDAILLQIWFCLKIYKEYSEISLDTWLPLRLLIRNVVVGTSLDEKKFQILC